MAVEGESTQTAVTPVDGGDAAINLNIRCSYGKKFSVRSTLRSTVVAFKDLLAQNCDVPTNQQRLIYKGRILKDDQTLDSYGLQTDHTVHMVRGSPPAPATDELAACGDAGAPLLPGLGGTGASDVLGSMIRDTIDSYNRLLVHILNNPAIPRETLEGSMDGTEWCYNIVVMLFKELSSQVNGVATRCTAIEQGQTLLHKKVKELEAQLEAALALKTKVTELETQVEAALATKKELEAKVEAAFGVRMKRRKTGGEPSEGR